MMRARRTYRLELTQTVPPTPGQASKEPMVIPLALGLVGDDGNDLPLKLSDGRMPGHDVLTLTKPTQSFVFADVGQRPVLSLNRGFSAPIKLVANLSPGDLRFLARHDRDLFNRWQAFQILATRVLVEIVATVRQGGVSQQEDSRPASTEEHAGLIEALGTMLADGAMEPAFLALMLTLPGEPDIAREIGHDVDPDAIFEARSALKRLVGNKLAAPLFDYYRRLSEPVPYQPDPVSVGRRALRNSCLDLLIASGSSDAVAVALRQCQTADNMTDRIGALSALALRDVPERGAALDDFYERYQGEPLIIDKWFSLQATIAEPATLDRVKKLTAHPAFSFANPNRVRALIHAFARGNQKEFNRADGAGYGFVIDFVLALDQKNPQVAARLLSAFKSWRVLEPGRRALAQAALRRVAVAPAPSPDVGDIVRRALAEE